MSLQSIGDLASNLVMRRLIVQTKQSSTTLATETSTAQTADPTRHTNGALSKVASIERRLAQISAQEKNVTIAQTRATAVQSALSQMSQVLSDTRGAMVVTDTADQTGRQAVYDMATGAIDDFVSALNSTSAGRGLFSGTAGSQAIDPQKMSYDSMIDGTAPATDILAAIDNWFSDPVGGFSEAYSGSEFSNQNSGITDVSDPSMRATDVTFRSSLSSLVIIKIANDPNLDLSDTTRRTLMETSIERLGENESSIVTAQASVGNFEDRLDIVQTRNSSEATTLKSALQSLLGVDQAEAAVKLQQSQSQLEMLYSITARMSRLSLVDYIR